ncbi:hypothetical protein FJT64_011467 [Amphibalanus amphitrite]|uniref:Chitin-binding type-2 domain-containing protein n=1 Tax=Amphibalanus amphitrite TaxID=1232801 RepID=A0A6A4VAV2_AMPAM|nr:hypothetical protein FJT64_011467 [Amphibalanus amphitrite]
MKVVLVSVLLTQLCVITSEPISTLLFPDDPEFPAYKEHLTTTTRRPVRVHNGRQQKNNRINGISQTARSSRFRPDPNAKKQLTDVTSYRQARRQFRFPIMRHCDKYLECVFSSGYLRSCAPGTQFDSVSAQCTFPYKARCADDFELYDGPDDLAAAASTLPPLTPSVMETPTAQLRADGSVSTECPRPAGMFAIPNRCDAFLNCWAGVGHVQQCAPGTLFNCHTEKCDFPHNVRCVQPDKPQAPMIDVSQFARNGVQARSRFGSVMAPPSGQRLRVRGGRSLSQGHVQMYHEGQWNHVCEDEFTRHMADTVCWDMGFKRYVIHRNEWEVFIGWVIGNLLLFTLFSVAKI